MKKRMLALILVSVLLVSLFSACGKGEKDPAAGLSVGYGMVDVTPPIGIPLGGYQGADSAANRRSTAVEWPFHALCVAFTDGTGNTVLIMVLDMLNAYMADGMRDAVSGATGVPKENIMFHCTHNHSGPDIRVDAPFVNEYISQLTSGVLSAAKNALEDRKPVTGMFTTYARPEMCNSERHYLLADGSYQSYGVGAVPKDQLIGHFGVADNLLQLVKFTREGGKDVVLVNWQGHPPGTDPNTIATSNYPGVLRNYLNTNLNCESVFLLGGSGNLNNNSQIAGEIRHENYQELGVNLGAAAVEAAANFTQRSLADISIKEKMLQVENRNTYGATKVWVYAASIGDFAFVTAPFEIFDDNAVAVREASPYPMTMYISCCNGSNGYLPTPYSFDWEITYEASNTSFVPGTAEFIQEELTGLLSQIATEDGYQSPEKAQDYYQAPFEPKSDGNVYINPAPGVTDNYKAAKNDFFAFQMLFNGKVKNFLCKDEALVKQILAMNEAKFLVDEQNVVVGLAD